MNNTARQSIWNPWHELNNSFEDTIASLLGLVPEFTPMHEYPPVNVWKNENLVKLSIKLPGVKLEDIEINIKHDTLNIKCSRKAADIPAGTTLRRQERVNGSWQRTFALPFSIDNDAVEASYKDGILNITLPKAKAEMPRKITINAQ